MFCSALRFRFDDKLEQLPTHTTIVFYDGLCGLCDKSVQFVLKHDKHKRFMFCALQSTLANKILGSHYTTDSFVLWHQGNAYFKSTAALRTLKILGGFWALFYVLMLVPAPIRHGVYNFIARNRYKWFGKFDACKIPDSLTKERFIG